MKIIRGFKKIPLKTLYIGSFDTLHRGHQSLFEQGGGLLRFYPHPLVVVAGIKKTPRVISLREELSLLSAEALILIRFTHALSKLSAEEFLDLICQSFSPQKIIVGPDAKVGRKGEGTVEVMRGILAPRGVTLVVKDFLNFENKKIGSTDIARCIEAGDVTRAATLLGRPFTLYGKRIKGEGRGSGIGIPTVNMSGIKQFLPANGVYETILTYMGNSYTAVTNIGIRPTFSGKNISVETHVPNASLLISPRERFTISFVRKIRDEKKFNSAEELIAQIKSDIADLPQKKF